MVLLHLLSINFAHQKSCTIDTNKEIIFPVACAGHAAPFILQG